MPERMLLSRGLYAAFWGVLHLRASAASHVALIAVWATLSLTGVATHADDAGFVPFWNGKDFAGWTKVGGGATYRVEGSEIVGEVGPGPNTFLRTDNTYGNFVFKVEVKLDIPGNSGLQFRSHQKNGTGQVFGYQCEIDPSPRAWSAGIYDEGRRGWLFPLAELPDAQKAYRAGEWNQFVISANGPVLQTSLNGIPCADLIDTADLEGFIALQVHAGKEGRIRWRNLLFQDLGVSTWQPMWDGKTFDGWNKSGGGDWKIEEGAIHGTSVKTEKRHGHLFANSDYSDFAIRLKYFARQGNSGLYFRVEQVAGDLGVAGLQAEIDPDKDAGGLYETAGRGWIVHPTLDQVKKWYKPNQWNEMSVVALDRRIVVHLNGHQTADVKNDPGRTKGRIALQLHGGADMDVQFKDIEILPLTPAATNGNPATSL